MESVYIYDTVRTPRGKGKSKGALYERRPIDLLTTVLDAIRERNQLDTSFVDDFLLGCVTPVDDQGYNIAKAGLMYAGWSDRIPALQLNRFCASGLEAINLGAAKIMASLSDLIIAGGVESMSRVPIGSDGGALLHDPELINTTAYMRQGVSADLWATLRAYTRTQLDEFALRSHVLAAEATEKGYFKPSMIPVLDCNGLIILDSDENIRTDSSMEVLGRLQPSFQELGEVGFDDMAISKYPAVERVEHIHTAGNSSAIVDGASLVLIGSSSAGERLGLKARARILSSAVTSSEPTLMLSGPISAIPKALKSADLKIEDIDLFEINEAFASVVLAVKDELNIPLEKINVNGGAISMGHPLGASGAILIGTLLDELERRNLKRGLVSLCAGGGIGIATIIERI